MTSTEIQFGVLLSVATLIWITMEYLVGFHSVYIDLHPYSSLIFVAVTFLIMIKGVQARKKKTGGHFGYHPAFMSGFYIVIVSVLLSPLVNYIFHTFINPDFFTAMIDKSVSAMKMTEDKAREYFNLKNYIQQSIVGGVITGSFLSLLIALILGRRKSA